MAAVLASLIDHVWQSTIVGAAIWMATLRLKQNSAAVRYRLWMAASLKCLVPFSALLALGGRLAWRSRPAAAPASWPLVAEQLFSPQASVAPAASGAVAYRAHVAPILLVALWIAGAAAVLFVWCRQWRAVRVALRQATPADPQIQAAAGMPVWLSASRIEPGVVGIFRPVLLLPRNLGEHVSPAGLDAILAHEACHRQRRDNLSAAMHMAVEAIFWFHPGVWWIERRLVEERERACDEAVLQNGAEPRAYAEAILHVCRYYVLSPSIAAAGVAGADLKRRIEAIVGNRRARPLSRLMALTIALGLVGIVSGPVTLGAVAGARPTSVQVASPAPSAPLVFQAATIKPNRSPEGSRAAGFQPGGRFLARNMPLRNLVAIAYGEPNPLPLLRVVGGPDWLDTERFDVEATAGGPGAPAVAGFSTAGELMLRSLLAERFNLAAHSEKRELPVFALVALRRDGTLASGVTTSNGSECAEANSAGVVTATCGLLFAADANASVRHYRARSVTMDQLAKSLGSYLGLGIDRLVVNQTGLSGAFSFDLQFATPEPGGTPPDSGVSIFTALQDQAGLRLESTRAPIDVVVIDRADRLRDDAASVDPPAAQSTKPATATPAQASQPPVAPPRTVAGAPLTAAIAGVVIDSLFGDPLAGVAVDVSAEDAPDNPRAVTTDAHGAFAVDGLAAGVYIVVLHHDDYQTFKREGLRISAGETRKVTAALRFNPIRD